MNTETKHSKYQYQGLKSNTDSLCWDCKLAGMCHKPINGWDAIYNPILSWVDTNRYRSIDSWFVKSCPKFVPERWVKISK